MVVWCLFFFKQKTAYEFRLSLVGSGMCMRDRFWGARVVKLSENETSRVRQVGTYQKALGLSVRGAAWNFRKSSGSPRRFPEPSEPSKPLGILGVLESARCQTFRKRNESRAPSRNLSKSIRIIGARSRAGLQEIFRVPPEDSLKLKNQVSP